MPTSTLPTPRMTATLIPASDQADDHALGHFVIHGQPGWEDRLRRARLSPVGRRAVHCTSCGKRGHNSRSKVCPSKAVLRAHLGPERK